MSKQVKDTAKPASIFHQSSNNNFLDNNKNNDQYSLLSNTTDPLKSENNQKYNNILNLQKSTGNQAVQRLIGSEILQPKLKDSNHSDPYEQEADSVSSGILKNGNFSAIPSNSDSNYRSNFAVSRKNADSSSIGNLTDKNSTLINSVLQRPGKQLDVQTRSYMESRLGYNFNNVRIHSDNKASKSAESINAKAYTVGSDIVFGDGQYNPSSSSGENLLAHELTHVVQQNSNKSRKNLQMKSVLATTGSQTRLEGEANKNADKISALKTSKSNNTKQDIPLMSENPFDLEGVKTLDAISGFKDLKSTTNKQGKSLLKVKFGKIAKEGQLEVRKSGNTYSGKGYLDIDKHPLLPDSYPGKLVVNISRNQITGKIGLPDKQDQISSLFGIAPLVKKPTFNITNEIKDGGLKFGIKEFPISIGNVIQGKGKVMADGDKLDSSFAAEIKLKGLGKGTIDFKAEKGVITGSGKASVILKEGKFNGNLEFNFNGESITGEGEIGYNSEKFSGEVLLQLMDIENAKSLKEGNQEAATENNSISPAAETGGPGLSTKPENKAKKTGKYVIAGEGDLNFAFTDWLTGSAHVIVDPEGDITVVGDITPAKEIELFPQKPFRKDLAKFEARAGYGFPVIGTIGVFAGIEIFLWAEVGPGLLRDIKIEGKYSTKESERQNYSIGASVNISAAAGITLRGEGGLVLTILKHDIKVGVGANGTLGIKGYANAPVIIGYREEGDGSEDKKGIYFISGEIEIAAQPFLSLAGDLFIELDSPWISPLPDKTWRWPLGEREWPLGGSFGVKASVEHILGSKEVPNIEFQAIEFSGDKFMTDIIDKKTAPAGKRAAEKAGQWKERNVKNSSPPPTQAASQKGGVREGAVPQKDVLGTGTKSATSIKSDASSTKQKKKEKMTDELRKDKSDPKSKDAKFKKLQEDKKRVENELEKKDSSKGKGKKGSDKQVGEEQKKQGETEEKEKDHEIRWQRGTTAVKQALKYAEKEGISKKELDLILRKIGKEYGFSKLVSKQSTNAWIISGSMSELVDIEEIEFVTDEQVEKFERLVAYFSQNDLDLQPVLLRGLATTNNKFHLGKKLNEIERNKEEIVNYAISIATSDITELVMSPEELKKVGDIKGKQPAKFDRGNFMHKYARRLVPGLEDYPDAVSEYTIDQRPEVSKYRVDFVDFEIPIVIEIKSSREKERGRQQALKYALKLAENERYRKVYGKIPRTWEYICLTYSRSKALPLLAAWLREENPKMSETESITQANLIAKEFHL